jgi:hypothetical protein
MHNLLAVIGGVVIGLGLFIGLMIALPDSPTHRTAAPAMGAMSSRMMGSDSLAARKLSIQHVQNGCHVWSDGKSTAAKMRLNLRPGQKLSIVDQDVDAHQMLEFAGPAHLRMGKAMTTSHGMTLAFPMKGVYRLGTRTVEMPGMDMEVKTMGPDNELRLVVRVA